MSLGQNTSGRDIKNRFLILAGFLMFGVLMLCVRLYRLQITQGDEYAAKSVANFAKEIRLRADRGMIRDRTGEILVDNRPSFDLYITPAFCERCDDEVIPKLAGLLGWDELTTVDVKTRMRAARRSAAFQPQPAQIDLNRDQVDLVNAHNLELDGVEVVPVAHRSYHKGPVLSHLLGYMNEIEKKELESQGSRKIYPPYFPGDFIGRRGLERSFEGDLRGQDGVRFEVVNARGRSIPELGEQLPTGLDQRAPIPGKNLVLSIDQRLQDEAERAFPGVAGAVVVVEVKTGFILTVVSRPGFDPNVLTGRVSGAQMESMRKDPLQPMIFRPTAQHYSPGSTFKVVTALAALKSGIFPPHAQVNCPGGYRLGARTWRCWNDHGHGIVDARRALQQSCDTYYYKVADTIGLDPIAEMGKALGLGQPTAIAVVAEVPGIMPSTAYHNARSPGGYTKGMALNSAIGQGDDNVTPLQLAMLYAAIANGGTLYKPQLVLRVENVDGTVEKQYAPEVVRNVEIPEEHRQVVVNALTAVVNEAGGTAYRSRLKDVLIAGKTGTAQVARLGAVRLKKEQMDYFQRDHAWFASFAPATSPEIAVVVLNEHGGHGGSDAAPTAAAVIQKYFDLKKQAMAPTSVAGVPAKGNP